MSSIAEFLQQVNDTKPGECFGGCKKMITKEDLDHAYCNSCWEEQIAKMPQVHVSFAGDNADTLMKPPPSEVRTFKADDPPSSISSGSSDEEEQPELKKSANAWVPPHLREKKNDLKTVQAPSPAPLTRKPSVQYDLSLQCDEEFRSNAGVLWGELTSYCPGCESGCDADSAHCAGHSGQGYHPDCYMNAEEPCMWCSTPCEGGYCSSQCYHADESSMGMG